MIALAESGGGCSPAPSNSSPGSYAMVTGKFSHVVIAQCLVQVSNWFANARRRLKRTVVDPRLTWAGRIRLYDSYVVGKQEPLDVSSDDDDDDDDDGDCDVTGGQIFGVGQLLQDLVICCHELTQKMSTQN